MAGNDMSLADTEIIAALQSYVPDTAEERRLVRKADMVLLPLLWWMYILAYLDRGNIVSIGSSHTGLWDKKLTSSSKGQCQRCRHEPGSRTQRKP